MKDVEFLATVTNSLKGRFTDGSIVTKCLIIILFPLLVVFVSKEPFKVKFFLLLIALFIYPFYFGFLYFVLPLLLLGSIFLELRDITFKRMLGYVPHILILIGSLVVLEAVVLLITLNDVQIIHGSIPVVLDLFGNVDPVSELYLTVTNYYLNTTISVTFFSIIMYLIVFYVLFFRSSKNKFLTDQETIGLNNFIKKLFYYLPIIHVYALVGLVVYILQPAEYDDIRIQFYIIHMFTQYTFIWIVLGLLTFAFIFVITEELIKRRFDPKEQLDPESGDDSDFKGDGSFSDEDDSLESDEFEAKNDKIPRTDERRIIKEVDKELETDEIVSKEKTIPESLDDFESNRKIDTEEDHKSIYERSNEKMRQQYDKLKFRLNSFRKK